MPEPGDEELLAKMAAGDENAFTLLYGRRQGGIYRFALQMTGSAVLAEDVTQEVFLALVRDGTGYDPERGSVAAYLYGMARNLVRRTLGETQGSVALDDDHERRCASSEPGALSNLSRRETIESVRRAVLGLPAHYREVIVLCDLHEMEYADAARALGCAQGTVRSRLHRARALLGQKLNRSPARPARCSS